MSAIDLDFHRMALSSFLLSPHYSKTRLNPSTLISYDKVSQNDLHLLASKDEPLLGWRNSLLLLYTLFDSGDLFKVTFNHGEGTEGWAGSQLVVVTRRGHLKPLAY